MQIQSPHILYVQCQYKNVFMFQEPWIRKCMNPFTHMNEWMNTCANAFTHVHTHYSNQIIVTNLAVSFSSSSVRHIITLSLWTPSQGKLLCFSEGRAPWAEFGVWLNIFFFFFFFPIPSLSNILAVGFEMPLQLQIDSSGFLRFYYLSFSIRLKGEKVGSCARCLDPGK